MPEPPPAASRQPAYLHSDDDLETDYSSGEASPESSWSERTGDFAVDEQADLAKALADRLYPIRPGCVTGRAALDTSNVGSNLTRARDRARARAAQLADWTPVPSNLATLARAHELRLTPNRDAPSQSLPLSIAAFRPPSAMSSAASSTTRASSTHREPNPRATIFSWLYDQGDNDDFSSDLQT